MSLFPTKVFFQSQILIERTHSECHDTCLTEQWPRQRDFAEPEVLISWTWCHHRKQCRALSHYSSQSSLSEQHSSTMSTTPPQEQLVSQMQCKALQLQRLDSRRHLFSLGIIVLILAPSSVTQANQQQIIVLSHTPAVVQKKKRRRSRKNKSDSDTVSTVSSSDNSSNDGSHQQSPNRRRRTQGQNRYFRLDNRRKESIHCHGL